MRTVMVFGTFDGIHGGHRSFLQQAKAHGEYLIVVVSRDEITRALKGHLPKRTLVERMEEVRNENVVDEVREGDREPGQWEVIETKKPHAIVVGYDQISLLHALQEYCATRITHPKIITAYPYHADTHHTSLGA